MTDAQNKALYIKEQCMAAGMTMAGASGVIASVEAESAFKETNLQDSYERPLGMNDASYTAAVDNGSYQNFTGDEAGYGLAQWTAKDRKRLMLAYFRQRGKSIGDFRTQVEYLIYEMRTGYAYVWRTCCTSDAPYACGYAVCKYYEIPANTEVQAQSRGQLAKNWYDWLKANSGLKSTYTGGQPAANVQESGKDAQTEQPAVDEDGIPIEKTWPPRTVDRNCSGWPEMKLLQAILRCRGYNVAVDGIWGKSTQEAVTAFQRANGLAADAIAGPLTWAKLLER